MRDISAGGAKESSRRPVPESELYKKKDKIPTSRQSVERGLVTVDEILVYLLDRLRKVTEENDKKTLTRIQAQTVNKLREHLPVQDLAVLRDILNNVGELPPKAPRITVRPRGRRRGVAPPGMIFPL